jgi:hypothetical protein
MIWAAAMVFLSATAFGQTSQSTTSKPTTSKTADQAPAAESPSTHPAFSSRDRETIRVYFKTLLAKASP